MTGSMDVTRRVVRAITITNVGLVIALCVFGIVWSWGGLSVPSAVASVPLGVRILIGVFALAAAIVDLVFLYRRYLSRYDDFLKVKTADGMVQVAVTAIEESLARTAKSLPEVHDSRVRIYRVKGNGNPVVVRVNFAAWEGTNVREVSQKVQQVMQMRFEQICGTEIMPRYQVYLARIDMKEVRKVSARADRASEEPVDLFRGPVYPTGDDL